MKITFFLMISMLFCLNVFAQQPGAVTTQPPLPLREVSGLVMDETDHPLPGAVILLVSVKDTLRTITDESGIFVFKTVKRATFLITVSGIGVKITTKKYFNNDLSKKIVLDPIRLKPEINELKEVKIDGKPSIIYKVDTVEYKASDYKVRENATVDELLKKMPGMEVGRDGSLTYQGQKVTKAKLNGKDFAGGGVAQAIQNLPADIVDLAQIVDDYGDQAARTGIKDGIPNKILNLTTKADRSIGTFGKLTAQAGNDDRYDSQLTAFHLNANQTITLLGRFDNTVNGIAGDVNGKSGSPGTTRNELPSFSYRDQWGKKVEVLMSYTFRATDNNAINQSYGENYSYGQNSLVKNTSSFNRQSTSQSSNRGHTVSFAVDYNINKFNYLKITPSFNYSGTNNAANALTDNIDNFITGFEHPVVKTLSDNLNANSNYGVSAVFQHIFIKPKRNFSVQIGFTNTNSKATGNKFTDYNYFADSTQNTSIRDSMARLSVIRSNNNKRYNAVITHVEPVGEYGQFEFTGSVNRSAYDDQAVSDTVLTNGQIVELPRLSNIFNYSFTEVRTVATYAYNGTKLSYSIGIAVIPSFLDGAKIDDNTAGSVSTSISNFRIIPVLRFAYSWSQTERFTLSYSGSNSEPNFQQIQPFTDRTDPNNIIVGNPNLKPEFTNTINATYNKYIPNSKITYGVNLSFSNYLDKTVTDVIQLPELISTSPTMYKTINETNFTNLSGSRSASLNYTLSKKPTDNCFLSINGNISYGYNVAMSNEVLYHNTNWRVNERFGPQFSITDAIEINPYIGEDVYRTFTSLPGATPTLLQTTSLAVDGRVYFLKAWQINYSATKSYVVGLSNLTTNPFVINAGFERTFLQKKNLIITFNANDLLHQNNFIQQTVTPQGVTYTLSNTSSRYFLVGARLILQKWGGKPQRNGKILQRKGDGSFIY